MKTLAIVSRKGGSGKTTIALHLAVAAEALGLTVAVFDLDPQASASIWGDRRGDDGPAVVAAQAPRLAALLDHARKQNADLVILDTAPHADSIAAEAVAQADAVLIPCRPSALDLDAVGASVRWATNADKPAFVIPNAVHPQGDEAAQMREALESAGVTVSPVILTQRKPFSSFIQAGRTALEGDPNGKAAEEIRQLAQWICEKVIKISFKKDNKISKRAAA